MNLVKSKKSWDFFGFFITLLHYVVSHRSLKTNCQKWCISRLSLYKISEHSTLKQMFINNHTVNHIII